MAKNHKVKPDKMLMSVNNYSGDPEITEFFFNQIRDIQQLNSWSEADALIFLRSKLSGSALKFFIDSPSLKNETSLENVQKEFSKFFRPVTQQQASQKWNAIKMQDFETVRNLSHRIDAMFSKAFPDILDPNAINAIKFNQLIATIPLEYKTRILEQEITNFQAATDKAQLLQDIEQQASSSSSSVNAMQSKSSNDQFQNFSEQLNYLSEQISELKSEQTANLNRSNKQAKFPKQYERKSKPNHFRQNMRNRTNFKPYQNTGYQQKFDRRHNSSVRCFFCNKTNHVMRDCRFYLATLSSQNHRQNNTNFNQNRNSQNSSLNPHANSFPVSRNSEN